MWVGQEADVEDEVGVKRDAVFESEAEAGDEEVVCLFLGAEAGLDVRTQLVNVEVRCVDEDVGHVADGVENLALFDDGAGDGLHAAQWVRASGLRVAADEDGVLRVEKNDRRRDELFDDFENVREAVEGLAFADVDDDGGLRNFTGAAHEFGEVGEEFEREIFDGLKADVFKCAQDAGFAGAADAGDDDQFLAGAGRFFLRRLDRHFRFSARCGHGHILHD